MPINNFKSDQSFLEKLAVGAEGVKATMNRMRELGYQPIELERGSSDYKIWKKIKIRRVRVPDILCLRSGQRVESRGKTKLEISMSHSLKEPKRAWDAGLRPDDMVSFVLLKRSNEESPVDLSVVSPVHFIRVEDMQRAFSNGFVRISQPKGVEEGSEIRVIWPCTVSQDDAIVTSVADKFIVLTSIDNSHKQVIRLPRKGYSLYPQCKVGDVVQKNQIVASVVSIDLGPCCDREVDEIYYQERLKSISLSERYAAAKALRFLGFDKSMERLSERMLDFDEDIYVKLEAAAALAANDKHEGWEFLRNSIGNPYPSIQLETVIVLSEIPKSDSEDILISVLMDKDRESEIRSGAAWGLREFMTQKAADALIDTFNFTNHDIKVEAARALLKIAPPQMQYLVDALIDIDPERRDGIAWTLARIGKFDLLMLKQNKNDDKNLRKWISYIAGYGRNDFTEEQLLSLSEIDPEVYFAASVLWQILDSWIYNLEEI